MVVMMPFDNKHPVQSLSWVRAANEPLYNFKVGEGLNLLSLWGNVLVQDIVSLHLLELGGECINDFGIDCKA